MNSEHQRKVRRSLRRFIAKFQGIINDTEYWNSINPQHRPLDCEGDKVFISIARKALDALDAGHDETLVHLMAEIERYAAVIASEE